MSRTTNARIAGAAFLVYIAAGITEMTINGRARAGADVADKLASIAQHASDMRITLLFGMVEVFCALVLAVTLWALTREVDSEVAAMAMVCRVAEGFFSALAIPHSLSLLWLANTSNLDPAARSALGSYLLNSGGGMAFTATFFAVGSLLFAWLLLRGRVIPIALAWIGVLASLLLVVVLPLQLAGFVRRPVGWIWLPMILFEVPLAIWFLVKGARPITREHLAV